GADVEAQAPAGLAEGCAGVVGLHLSGGEPGEAVDLPGLEAVDRVVPAGFPALQRGDRPVQARQAAGVEPGEVECDRGARVGLPLDARAGDAAVGADAVEARDAVPFLSDAKQCPASGEERWTFQMELQLQQSGVARASSCIFVEAGRKPASMGRAYQS